MTTDERNFRSSYYGKVGCYSVEEKKSLNKLLQDKIRNQNKLKQFCLSYTVPTTQRALLWSIILGVLPLHKNSTEYIQEQRCAVYDDLLQAVTVMQCISSKTPKSQVLHTMWLLENNRLIHRKAYSAVDANFMEIVKVLLQVFDNDVETYWISKQFFIIAREISDELPKLKELTQKLLKRDDIILNNHFIKLNLYGEDSILDTWYTRCFAGVLCESALVKAWDKICGGSSWILVFVFLELVKVLRDRILSQCHTQTILKELIEQVKDQDAAIAIINKAIKSWQSNKTPSEFAIH